MSDSAAAVLLEKRLRVSVVAADPVQRAWLRRLLVDAGHDVVESVEAADVVLSVAVGLIVRSPGPAPAFTAMKEPSLQPLLTPREIEILGAMGKGLPNKLIARELGISLHTVKFHLESIFRKLGARTRTEAVARALERSRSETIHL
jgi:DNA-binding NarL/FixJ family response regulator